MGRNDILALLGEDWLAVEKLIRTHLHSDVDLLESINEALVSNSGKMLRPILSLLGARACGGSVCNEDSVKYAAAVEILHNATLLHDDVADKSDTRRGVPTVFSKLGATPAVLVGDYWLARCVELVLKSESRDKVMLLFAKTLTDLAEGEMLQLEKAAAADTTIEDYLRIIYCKTASLFEVALMAGAMSVVAPSEYVAAVKSYANALGMAFQIKDDILDYEGGNEVGKPLGADLKEGKITLPLLGALNGFSNEAEIRSKVKNAAFRLENNGELIAFVRENGGVEYAKGVLDEYVDKACDALKVLPASEEKEMLIHLAKYTASRNI